MSIDIKNLKIAKRYAIALLESTMDSLDEVLQNLSEINEIVVSNKDFQTFFEHPSVSMKDKKDTINELFENKINKKALDFLHILLDENRFNIFSVVYDVFQKEAQKVKNQQCIIVESAIALDEAEKEKIKQKLSEKLSKEIILNCQEKEDIIGGLVVKVNDKIVDLSLRAKFNNLRKV